MCAIEWDSIESSASQQVVPEEVGSWAEGFEVRFRVGVVSPEAFKRRAHLFDVLEALFPVRFEPRTAGAWRDLDAVIACPGNTEALPYWLPTFAAQAEPRQGSRQGTAVQLSESRALDRRLRGAVLTESTAPAVPVSELGGSETLAVWDGRPAWSLDPNGCHYTVALAPEPLQEGVPLLSLLRPARFLSLLPLIHFLRQVAPSPWQPPQIRAAFLFDDPNLHWRTYGHIDYRVLADQSRAGGFHVAFAMVPVDGWFVHAPTAQLFREASRHLSLVFHGNDHRRAELGRVESIPEGVRLVRRAVSRVERFERRTGLRVARIMAPPHGRYSRAAVRALHREGFEALTADRSQPSTDPFFPVQPLAGWNPLELLDGGFPILPRIHIDSALELGILRAFLDQPLVFYGHHEDLAKDPDRLSDLASAIDRLGVSSWARLDTITRGAVSTRLDGGTFWVRPFAREVSIRVPVEAQTIQIEAPATANNVLTRRVSEGRVGWRTGKILEGPRLGGDLLEIVLKAPLSPELPPASRSGWPPIRRMMTEARDRAQALTPWRIRASARPPVR
jgi:hypothetical protein